LHLWRDRSTAGVQLAQIVSSWECIQENTICAHGMDHGDGVQVKKVVKLERDGNAYCRPSPAQAGREKIDCGLTSNLFTL